jgi:hypothetical protein
MTRLPPEIENPYLLRCDDGTGIPLNPGLPNRAGEPLIPFEPRVPSQIVRSSTSASSNSLTSLRF